MIFENLLDRRQRLGIPRSEPIRKAFPDRRAAVTRGTRTNNAMRTKPFVIERRRTVAGRTHNLAHIDLFNFRDVCDL